MKSGISNMKGTERIFLFAMVIWTLLQLSRFIAVTLIGVIDAGNESEAWRYPAQLDLFAAVLAIPLAWTFIMRRGLFIWTFTVVYFAISIVDHVGNFVTTTYVGAPSIAEGMSNPYLPAIIMTVFDALFLVLLFIPRFRDLFFRLEKSTT